MTVKTLFLFILVLMAMGAPLQYAMALTVDYSVPTQDPSLQELNHFKLEVSCSRVDGQWTLAYNYPRELTGVDFSIKIHQSRFEPALYFGGNGEMKCVTGSCAVHYNDLPFNELALRSYLKQISLSDLEFASRMGLALSNRIDPGGVFSETPEEYCSK